MSWGMRNGIPFPADDHHEFISTTFLYHCGSLFIWAMWTIFGVVFFCHQNWFKLQKTEPLCLLFVVCCLLFVVVDVATYLFARFRCSSAGLQFAGDFSNLPRGPKLGSNGFNGLKKDWTRSPLCIFMPKTRWFIKLFLILLQNLTLTIFINCSHKCDGNIYT